MPRSASVGLFIYVATLLHSLQCYVNVLFHLSGSAKKFLARTRRSLVICFLLRQFLKEWLQCDSFLGMEAGPGSLLRLGMRQYGSATVSLAMPAVVIDSILVMTNRKIDTGALHQIFLK